MKTSIRSIQITTLLIFILGCSHSVLPVQKGIESCEGVPPIPFKEAGIGTDLEKTFKILADIAAAGTFDANQSTKVSASASIKSELAKKLNEHVSASYEFTTDFWEAETLFTRLYCSTKSLLDRTDLSVEQKDKSYNLLLKIISDRNTFLTEKSKKKQESN